MNDPTKLYRLFLKLYPARFREEYGTPLEQQFLDEYREAGGALSRFVVWLRMLSDLALSIPLELAREVRQDLGYSIRIYSRRPCLTFLAVAAMALAIGATTGVFSVVNALLLRSLPFRSPERIVQFGAPFTPPDTPAAFHAWRTHSDYLEDAGMYSNSEMNLSGTAGSARIKVAETSSNFFSALGAEPEIGRAFASGEDVQGKNQVAVISYGLWQQFFGGDPRALGSTVHLNNSPLTVVGIAPPGLDYPAKTALWTPSVFDLERIPKSAVIFRESFGRLKSGVSLPRAQSMFDADRLHLSATAFKEDGDVKLIPLREQLAGPVRRGSLVLLGAVSFVLLIACANVANLLLTRITERRKELALRASLGASRGRLVQQLITESVLLTGFAATAGMLVANWATRLATAAQPTELTAQNYTILDWRVLAFATGLAAITGLAFGVVPAWLIGRLQPTEDLVRTSNDGSNSCVRRLRNALVTLQIALTLVLLGGSIVLGRSFLKVLGTDLGYRTDHVITLNVSLAGTRFDKPELRTQYYHDALDQLRKVPGVEVAGGVDALPLATNAFMGMDMDWDSSHKIFFSCVMWATPGYFDAMRTSIVAGRDFSPRDQQGAGHVAIVNEEFARNAGGNQAVLGHTVKSLFGKDGTSMTFVGVAHTVHYDAAPGDKPMPILFLPLDQNPHPFMTLVARVHGRPEAYLPIARDAIQSVDRQVPVFDTKTLDQRLDEALARPRFYTTAVVFFGAFGLLLAAIGVYGVASFSVIQRTHELGVRIAVGASAQRIRWMLLRQSLLPVAAGVAVGVAGAFALGQFLQHLLDSAQRVDGFTSAVAAAILVVIASIAVWSATQRIVRLDPMQVLRAE